MKRLLLIVLLLGCIKVYGQDTGEEKTGNWIMYFGNNKLSENYSLHTEAQLRLYEPFGNVNQLLIRVGLNRRIGSNSVLTAGYGYIPTSSFDKEAFKSTSTEHRIWEQFILTNAVGRLFFEHRYRLEQRWIFSASDDIYLNRLRYRLMVNIPLNNPEMTGNTVFLSFYDEVFLNITDAPFDQNRLFGALGYKFNNNLSVQGGYLRHRLGNLNYNRVQLALFFNTDLSKSKGK